LDAVAKRHGLTLLYEAREQRLPGPVTLMFGDDLAADLSLLAQALGPRVPLQITEFRAEKQLLVRDAFVGSFSSLAARPLAPPPPKRTLLARWFGRPPARGGAKSTAAIAASDPSAEQPPSDGALVPAPAPIVFELPQGERLSVGLERFLKSQGWSLVWPGQTDLEAITLTRIEGTSMKDVLEQLLSPLGLAVDLYTRSPRFAVIHATQPDTASTGPS
jgi:hypothetical protein